MRNARAFRRCYRQQGGLLTVIGVALAAAGLLLIFLCIPGWVWASLVGVGLIALGVLLIRVSRCGR